MGRSAASSSPWQPPSDGTVVPAADVPPEVLEFIRYCYRRRGFGWPELYDEMCAVAGRNLFRGWGADELNEEGIGFSLFEMPALAALVDRVVADEHRTISPPAVTEVDPEPATESSPAQTQPIALPAGA